MQTIDYAIDYANIAFIEDLDQVMTSMDYQYIFPEHNMNMYYDKCDFESIENSITDGENMCGLNMNAHEHLFIFVDGSVMPTIGKGVGDTASGWVMMDGNHDEIQK